MSSLLNLASPSPGPEQEPAFGPRRARQLPEIFTHRTPKRVYHDVLDTPDAADEELAPGERRDRAPKHHKQNPFHVLYVLTRTEFRARYRAQALGILWSLLHPLVMMGIISVVFSQLFQSNERYFPIFLLIGLLVWQWVTTSITSATTSFIQHADIIKRTIFARPLLPMSSVLSYGINFALESLVLLVFVPIFPGAFRLSAALLLVPVLLALLALLLFAITLATSVLNVIYRDVAYIVNTALLLLYWLTPVFYPIDVIPYPYRMLLQANPIAGILTALRRAIMVGEVPTMLGWAGILAPTALLLVVGWAIFRHYEHMVLDYV